LSGDLLSCLAATLENFPNVPDNASGAVLADGRQRACLSVKRNEVAQH
jgi:hypothetical protein